MYITLIYNFAFIGGPEESVPVVDASHLGTTSFREKLSGELKDVAPIPIRVQFDGTDGLPNIGATPETVTITWPIAPGDTVAASYAGTAFLSRRKFADMDIGAVDTPMIGEFDVVYNGGYNSGSVPAYTAGS